MIWNGIVCRPMLVFIKLLNFDFFIDLLIIFTFNFSKQNIKDICSSNRSHYTCDTHLT